MQKPPGIFRFSMHRRHRLNACFIGRPLGKVDEQGVAYPASVRRRHRRVGVARACGWGGGGGQCIHDQFAGTQRARHVAMRIVVEFGCEWRARGDKMGAQGSDKWG